MSQAQTLSFIKSQILTEFSLLSNEFKKLSTQFQELNKSRTHSLVKYQPKTEHEKVIKDFNETSSSKFSISFIRLYPVLIKDGDKITNGFKICFKFHNTNKWFGPYSTKRIAKSVKDYIDDKKTIYQINQVNDLESMRKFYIKLKRNIDRKFPPVKMVYESKSKKT